MPLLFHFLAWIWSQKDIPESDIRKESKVREHFIEACFNRAFFVCDSDGVTSYAFADPGDNALPKT